jgi:hypothetical protein
MNRIPLVGEEELLQVETQSSSQAHSVTLLLTLSKLRASSPSGEV